MEPISKYVCPAKYRKGQVVRLRAFPWVKLQILHVCVLPAVAYECISPDGASYKKDTFGEDLIEPDPDHELLPPYPGAGG